MFPLLKNTKRDALLNAFHAMKADSAFAAILSIKLSVSPAPLSYGCSLGQTNRVAHALTMRAVSVKTLSHDDFGHQMGIKYSMEGFIRY